MRRTLATRGRKRLAAAGALIVTASVSATVLSGTFSDDGGGSSRAATNATATTEIRRQDLVEVETEQGTLGYGDEREVVNRLSGTITRLPAEGAVTPPDRVLYRVDGEPVILLDGRVPAYRDLGSAVGDGADVAQLERNLRTLGYDADGAIELDDSWDAGTTAAVERWQDAHGIEQTGVIELGTIVFQPGKRRVASLVSTLGGDAGGGGPAGMPPGAGEEGASAQGTSARASFAAYPVSSSSQTEDEADGGREQENDRPETEDDPGADDPEEEPREEGPREQGPRESEPDGGPPDARRGGSGRQETIPQQPFTEGQQAPPAPPAGPPSGAGGPAEGPPPSNAVMTTTSTRPVITVDLDTSKIALATPGTRVEVELPSGEGARGRVTAVDSAAAAPETEQGAEPTASTDATVEVTIKLRAPNDALDQAPVVVDLERSRREAVLAVPVTALLARDRGEFAVEVRDGPRRRLVSVEPGLYAGGFVEVSGQGLRAGMAVTDARV